MIEIRACDSRQTLLKRLGEAGDLTSAPEAIDRLTHQIKRLAPALRSLASSSRQITVFEERQR